MLEKFNEFIKEKDLFSSKNKVLLAVSGGADSVVMAELFHRAGFDFGIAHCNFKMRGKASDQDEQFVKTLSKKYKVPFHTIRFNTKAYSKKEKISIQQAARDLRYKWFNEITIENGYSRIATAHHLNDSTETFFINLLRGSGIKGLTGIKVKSATIIRPLLFASRKEIDGFIKTEKLKFRKDASNDSDDYLRNRIRHHLMPMFLNLNPQFEKVMQQNLQNLEFANSIFTGEIEKAKSRVLKTGSNGDALIIDLSKLSNEQYADEILAEILRDYNFNATQCSELLASRKAGKQFFSTSTIATIDRGKVLLTPGWTDSGTDLTINAADEELSHSDFILKTKIITGKALKTFEIPTQKNVLCLDMNKLQFPVLVRKWQPADAFVPLGMQHRKKISDFLIDEKVSRPEKNKTYVALTEKEDSSSANIIGVLGHRIDNRFKITAGTKQIFYIEYLRRVTQA